MQTPIPPTTDELWTNAECGLNPIVDLLLQEKLLVPKQVEYATRVQNKLETPRSLLEVLKELNIIADDEIKKAVRESPSRSLNVLKKSEKGPLAEYQRSFSFWKISSARGQMLC